ncbi:hypothetical protein [Gimesia maris]|uniref:PDZ domain-containing protein n=1 Tax=Gimesia maris TaxID=122 RepID=A0ABX5YTH2_9PLAN|nr:hypothetical protein [Gimesia maris]QEG18902.1 hypothetical protein GmarT_47960 [Gimesia maris]QGQ28189.1 hypothetical protein F1729_05700 [Gimesia maris]
MRTLILLTILSCLSLPLTRAEVLPSQKYPDLGFDTVKVLDYKKALREQGEEIPRFPPRTANALIVKMNRYRTRIDSSITVVEHTRASNSELKDDDLIIVVNGKLLRSSDEGEKLLQQITYKDKLELRVIRRSGNNWERIDVPIKPFSDLEYYHTKITTDQSHDDDFSLCRFWIHRKAHSRFTDGNFQLYIKHRSDEPLHLYLQLSMFLPDAPLQKDSTKVDGFIIKTDHAKYRVAIDKEEKVDQQEEEQRRQKSIANFSRLYRRTTDQTREMLDELGEKIGNLETVPDKILISLERRGLARSQVALARMFEGWQLYDLPLKKDQRKMIEDIIASNKVMVYHESVPNKPFEVTSEQKQHMKDILAVFDVEGGEVGK